jgi:Tol biopolymer transport system component
VDFCVTDIAVDGEGHIWFASEGVIEFDGSNWRTYTEDDGLVSNIVYDIFIDEANNKWFGTYDGLSKFDGHTWTTYSTGDSGRDYIVAVAVDAAGRIWAGSYHDGASMFDGTTWHTYTTDNGLVSNQVRSIAVDHAGHIWIGTAGGVSEFDGHTWRTYTTADGLRLAWVYCIFADDLGHLWFCTSAGVAELIRPDAEPPAALTTTPTPTYLPTAALPEGRIAFTSDRDGGKDIYVMNADGSGQTNLTSHPDDDWGPDWSPDGMSIAFVSERDGNPEIYVMDADGTNQRRLTDAPSGDWWPAWSPDGRLIAFESDRDGNLEIYVMNADGSGQTNLTNHPERDLLVSWLPDSAHIVFESRRPLFDGYVMNADGSGVTRLTNYIVGYRYTIHEGPPVLSPDGTRFAQVSGPYMDMPNTEVRVANVDDFYGGCSTNLPGDCLGPAWSPDSTRIAFVSDHDGNNEIYVMNADCSDETNLTNHLADDSGPTWTDEGQYWSDQETDVQESPEAPPAQVDLGFRSNPNGYGFVNTQLERSEEMFEQYFGEENITDSDGKWCKGARSYFDKEYRTLGGADRWSCLGFSLTSLLSYLDQPQPHSGLFAIRHFERLYEQPESAQLTYSTRLPDSIAYYAGVQEGKQWGYEYGEWKKTCSTNPDEMVERIRTGIRDRKPVVLSLNTFVYGLHNVAPYRVEEASPNTIDVYVYDSEAPGQERIVHFEHEGDGWQWTYTFVGSVGAAGTRTAGCVDMYPFPVEIGREPGKPPFDFCQTSDRVPGKSSSRDDASPGQMLALVPAQGDVLIQDTLGRRIRWVGGTFVSEIPDAYEIPYALGDATLLHHTLRLPAAEYVVTANGSSVEAVELVFYVDGRFIELSARQQSTGSEVQLEIDSSLEQATLSSLQNLDSFALSLDNESAPESHLVTISGTPLFGSEYLRVSFDGAQVELSHAGGGLQQYDLRLENSGGQVFTSEPLTLEADETHTHRPTNWIELNSVDVTLEIDQDSDGTTDETLELENQSLSSSPERDESRWSCPCPLAAIGLVGLATLIGLTRQSMLRWTHR